MKIVKLMRSVYKFINILLAAVVVIPLVFLARLADERGYYNLALALAYIPFFLGEKLRYFFYRATLTQCGKNVIFKYGSCCLYQDIELHNNITVGLFTLLGKCTIGDNVLLGSYVNITSGNQQHKLNLVGGEAVFLNGKRERVMIEQNIWVGNNAVILKSIAKNCIIGAGSVVTRPTEANSIYTGNPAQWSKNIDEA